jgi:uncharacterized membrane protein
MSSEQTTTKLQFSTSQVFGEAWQILKAKWTFLLGVWAVIFGVSFVGEILRSAAAEQGGILPAFISLAIQVLSLILTIGSVKVVLKVVRGETADIAELFKDNVQFIWQYFLLSLVMSLIVIFGLILLIVPGVIWSLKYMFAPYALIDEKLSFSDAMAKSDEMTRGIKWQLFGFTLATIGLNLLGLLALGLGLIVTIPVSTLAGYVLYETLKKQLVVQKA